MPAARWTPAALTLLLLGATLGTALDAIHTFTRTTEYLAPFVLRTAWWVPLLFAGAGAAVGLPRAWLERRRASPAPVPPPRTTALAMTLFVAAYALSGTLPGGNVARTVALAALFAAAWLACDRTPLGLGLALATGLGGCVAEVALIRGGFFRHLQPDVLGLPLWLPWLYATAQVAVGQLGRRLVEPPAG